MFIDATGALVNTVSFGSGDRTLLAFGAWVFGWELWVGPMELLSQTWRTVGFDQRGSGSTVCAVEEISLAAMVSDVYAVMDALGIDRCVLGAESRGMIVAVQSVVGRPERFAGLLLVGGQPALPPRSAQTERFLDQVRTDLPGVVAGMVEGFLPEPNIEHLKRWTRHIGGRSDCVAAVAAHEAMVGADVRPLLPAIAVPTLLAHGELDSAVPLSVARENVASIPRGKLVVLEGTGHGPTVTRPRDVADAIDQYFVRR